LPAAEFVEVLKSAAAEFATSSVVDCRERMTR
jgi:hypothetical protein